MTIKWSPRVSHGTHPIREGGKRALKKKVQNEAKPEAAYSDLSRSSRAQPGKGGRAYPQVDKGKDHDRGGSSAEAVRLEQSRSWYDPWGRRKIGPGSAGTVRSFSPGYGAGSSGRVWVIFFFSGLLLHVGEAA